MKDYSLKINGHIYNVSIDEIDDKANVANVVVNGSQYTVEIAGVSGAASQKPHVTPVPQNVTSISVTPNTAAPSVVAQVPSTAGGSKVICPLPGTVVSLRVKDGDQVTAGQTLVVLEAMKMENSIDAERGGIVHSVSVRVGDNVMEGDVLMVIE